MKKVINKSVRTVLVLLVLLIILFTVLLSVLGEISIPVLAEVPSSFSQNEVNLAINNLNLKFEEDDSRPILQNVVEIYDFNEQPLYALYNFDNYYMIVIRETGTILERGEGMSKFNGMNGKLYYGEFFEAYQKLEGNIYNSDEIAVSTNRVNEMKSMMQNVRSNDYADYVEAMQTPQPYGEANRTRITQLGNSISKFKYFAEDINPYHVTREKNKITYGRAVVNEVLYTVNNFTPRNYGAAYYRKLYDKYDLLFPKNVYNACSLVTMTMLLQYYDRLNIKTDIVPNSISYSTDWESIHSNPTVSKAERIMRYLYPYIYILDGIGDTVDGAATYVNMDAAFDRYFQDNNKSYRSKHFTSYTNVKGAIDAGNPAIITIGAGRGFYKNDGASNYSEVDLSRHNVVVYGYTKNSIGVLDEFIVHANWHDKENNYGRIYMNKLYSAGNLYLQVL